jgi:hypothetical protein
MDREIYIDSADAHWKKNLNELQNVLKEKFPRCFGA